jgi:hypothetical protein
MLIEAPLLRLFWDVVETTQSTDWVTLSDLALGRMLLQQVSKRVLLSREESQSLALYISSRTQLIRDITDDCKPGYYAISV